MKPKNPAATRSFKARRIALPVFMGRISPVLDTCDILLLPEPGSKKQFVYRTVSMKGSSIYERASEMKKLGIQFIICGAVSQSYYNLLKEIGIELYCGINGEIEEVFKAYRDGKLNQPRFRMPGSD